MQWLSERHLYCLSSVFTEQVNIIEAITIGEEQNVCTYKDAFGFDFVKESRLTSPMS
jgi:hypothetical protein